VSAPEDDELTPEDEEWCRQWLGDFADRLVEEDPTLLESE
jgi:hypothetical protein